MEAGITHTWAAVGVEAISVSEFFWPEARGTSREAHCPQNVLSLMSSQSEPCTGAIGPGVPKQNTKASVMVSGQDIKQGDGNVLNEC